MKTPEELMKELPIKRKIRKVMQILGGQVSEEESDIIKAELEEGVPEEAVAETIRAMRVQSSLDKDKARIFGILISAVRSVLGTLTDAQIQAILLAFSGNVSLTTDQALEIARAMGWGHKPTGPDI